jgi:hypothetical protein
MSVVDGRGAVSSRIKTPTEARPFPFWVVQVTELIVALVFVDISVHVRGGGLLVAAAVAFAGLAVTAQGPVGLVRFCPQRLHLALVVAVAVLIAAAPLLPALRPDIEGIIVVEFGAIGLIRVATLTRASDDRAGVSGTRRGDRSIIEATASVVEPGNPSGGHPGTGRRGRAAGAGRTGNAARSAGRTAGAAASSGRRLLAKHRPTAEARLRQSIRTAGRWAGRMASPPDNGEPRGR